MARTTARMTPFRRHGIVASESAPHTAVRPICLREVLELSIGRCGYIHCQKMRCQAAVSATAGGWNVGFKSFVTNQTPHTV